MTRTVLKGSSINSTLDLLREEGTLDRVLAAMPEEHRSYFDDRALASSLTPMESFHALLEGVRRAYPDDPDGACFRIGRRIVGDGLNTVYKIFLKAGSPGWVLRRSPGLWQSYFKGSEIRILESGDTHGRVQVVEDEEPTAAACTTRLGGMVIALELAGAQDLDASHPQCRAKGDAACVFDLKWKAPR